MFSDPMQGLWFMARDGVNVVIPTKSIPEEVDITHPSSKMLPKSGDTPAAANGILALANVPFHDATRHRSARQRAQWPYVHGRHGTTLVG